MKPIATMAIIHQASGIRISIFPPPSLFSVWKDYFPLRLAAVPPTPELNRDHNEIHNKELPDLSHHPVPSCIFIEFKNLDFINESLPP